MWRHIVLSGLALLGGVVVYGQNQRHFALNNSSEFKKLVLNYTSTSGTTYISPSNKDEVLSVYGNHDIDNFNHSFEQETTSKVCNIDLKIEDKSQENFSQSISYKMFNEREDGDETIWKVYLSEYKPFNLNFNFGFGSSYIDLSGLSIEKMKVSTGSADIRVGYLADIPNQVEMDTFSVKVDLGSLQMRKVNLSRAQVIMAEVGFGNAFLDLSDPPSNGSYIDASVGAGNLEVLVPRMGTGIKVVVHRSLLCQVKLSKVFREVEEDVYVNEFYEEGGDNQLLFDVDVSLGNIVIKDKK